MNNLETIEALKKKATKIYYDFRHKQLENEIQRDKIKALENKIKALENTIEELTHRLIEQEIELSRLIKKVI
jgi:hypothetical protein